MKRVTLEDRIRKAGKPVVVEFWANWCGPCRMMAPALDQVQKEYAGRVELIKINADSETALLKELGVFSIPTLLAYREGHLVTRRAGAQTADRLRAIFETALNGTPSSRGLTLPARLLRVGAAAVIAAAGFYFGNNPILYLLSATVLFLAVYDRCPVWQFLTRRIRMRSGQ